MDIWWNVLILWRFLVILKINVFLVVLYNKICSKNVKNVKVIYMYIRFYRNVWIVNNKLVLFYNVFVW